MTFYELLKNIINKLGLAVRTDVQIFSDEQKAQARENIDAISADYVNKAISNLEFPTELPSVTSSDSGKFLRVSADGTWVAEIVPNAEEVAF